MRRSLMLATLLTVSACSSAPERGSLPPPLPDKVIVQSYGSLLERARKFASGATEASHVDDWSRLDESAKGLEQTAAYLLKADDVPAKHKDTIVLVSGDLRKLAKELLGAATAKDVNRTTEVLTRINNKVREMRLAE